MLLYDYTTSGLIDDDELQLTAENAGMEFK